jgi:hypothetical protein
MRLIVTSDKDLRYSTCDTAGEEILPEESYIP